jgi:hypothetical protein
VSERRHTRRQRHTDRYLTNQYPHDDGKHTDSNWDSDTNINRDADTNTDRDADTDPDAGRTDRIVHRVGDDGQSGRVRHVRRVGFVERHVHHQL